MAEAAEAVVAAPKKETGGGSGYRTRLASGSGYSQNQSQGIELDVHKEKVGAETEWMAVAGVVAGGVLWHGRSRGRGSHERQPWAVGDCREWVWWKVVVPAGRGSHGRQPWMAGRTN